MGKPLRGSKKRPSAAAHASAGLAVLFVLGAAAMVQNACARILKNTQCIFKYPINPVLAAMGSSLPEIVFHLNKRTMKQYSE